MTNTSYYMGPIHVSDACPPCLCQLARANRQGSVFLSELLLLLDHLPVVRRVSISHCAITAATSHASRVSPALPALPCAKFLCSWTAGLT